MLVTTGTTHGTRVQVIGGGFRLPTLLLVHYSTCSHSVLFLVLALVSLAQASYGACYLVLLTRTNVYSHGSGRPLTAQLSEQG